MEYRRAVLAACDAGGRKLVTAQRFRVNEAQVRRIRQERREPGKTGNRDSLANLSAAVGQPTAEVFQLGGIRHLQQPPGLPGTEEVERLEEAFPGRAWK